MAYISFTNPQAQAIANKVLSKISRFENIENNPNAMAMFQNAMEEALTVLNSTMSDMKEIKSLVGPSDSNYQDLSNEIALILIAFMHYTANQANIILQLGGSSSEDRQFLESTKLNTIKAFKFMELIQQNYYMHPDTKQIYQQTFSSLRNSVNRFQNKSGGCYVATYVYGDYDAPEVLKLRKYRDNTLSKSLMGRCFIKAYYTVSPMVVKTFGSKESFRKISKGMIEYILKSLENRNR